MSLRILIILVGVMSLTIDTTASIVYPTSTPAGETPGGAFQTYFNNMFASGTLYGDCRDTAQVVGGFTSTGVPLCVTPTTAGFSLAGQTAGDTIRFDGTSWIRNNLIYNNGTRVGINTTAPTTTLDINGQMRIRGGSPGTGRVLTSDINGLATWGTAPSPCIVGGTGTGNVCYGIGSLSGNTTGNYNLGLGYEALYRNVSSSYNVALGYRAGYNQVSGMSNTAIGIMAMNMNQIGRNNIAIGNTALYSLTGSENNVAIGNQSLAILSVGSRNVGVGANSFFNLVSGTGNLALGYGSAWSLQSGNGNIAIGNNSDFPSATGSNQLSIGNWIYGSGGNIGIGTGINLNSRLTVDGQIRIMGGMPGSGRVLISDTNGLASWAPASSLDGVGGFNFPGATDYASIDVTSRRGVNQSDMVFQLADDGEFAQDRFVFQLDGYTGWPNPRTYPPCEYYTSSSGTTHTRCPYHGTQQRYPLIMDGTQALFFSQMSTGNGNYFSGATAGNNPPNKSLGFGAGGGFASAVMFVDGDARRVGIGTISPQTALEVDSGINHTSGLRLTRVSPNSPLQAGGVVALGINGSGDVVPISPVSNIAVYTGVLRTTALSPNPNLNTFDVTYDFNRYFAIPGKQSFVVSQGNGPANNGPYFRENGVSSLCSWNGGFGSSPYDCATSGPDGLSASPWNSFTMTAKGQSFGYQLALGARGDAPLFARSGRFNGSETNGLYTNDGTFTTPAPWNKVLITPAHHPEYLYINTGLNSQLQAIAGAGNVGVGTTTPQSRFEIWTGSTTETLLHFRGNSNLSLGLGALTSNVTGSNNTAIGVGALDITTSGNGNVGLGAGAGANITTGSNNIMIGSGAIAQSATLSNQLNIGNWIYGQNGNIGIGTSAPSTRLEIGKTSSYGTGQVWSWPFSTTHNGQNPAVIVQNEGLLTKRQGTIVTRMHESNIARYETYLTTKADMGGIGFPGERNYYMIGFNILNSRPDVAFWEGGNAYFHGQVQIRGGNPGVGKVLTSDADGLATWSTGFSGAVSASGITGGTQFYVTRFSTGGNGLVSSQIFDNGTRVAIGSATPLSRFEIWSGSTSIHHMRGNNNIGFGLGSIRTATTGSSNVGFGNNTLRTLTTGYSNTAMGMSALYNNTTGFFNSAFGESSLYNNNSGNWNVGLGTQSLWTNIDGAYNVALGGQALYSNVNNSNSIAIGYQSLRAATANNNIAIGHLAGNTITTGANNILIGSNTTIASNTLSNQLNIGNWIYGDNGNIGIGTGANISARLTIDSGVNNTSGLRLMRLTPSTPVFGGVAAPLGVDTNGNVVIAQQGAIPVYTALGGNQNAAINTTTNPPTIGANYDRYFNINARQSFAVTDIGGNPYNCPEFQVGSSNKGSTGCSQTPWATYVMTAQNATSGNRYGYQILISDRTDAPFVVRGGMFSQTNGTLMNSSMTTPALWFKAITVPTNRSDWFYINPGVDQNNNPIAGGGNIGIGTTSPNAPLQFGNTVQNRKLVLYEDANNDHQFYGFGINASTLRYQGQNHVFYAGTSATTSNELLRIQANGSVGIGTSTPSNRLHVNGGAWFGVQAGSTDAILSNTTNIVNIVSPTRLTTNAIATPESAMRLVRAGTTGVKYNPSADFQIGTHTAGLNALTRLNIRLGHGATQTPDTDVMTLQSNGRVGIGTTNPTAALEVNGQIKITGGNVGSGRVLVTDSTGLGSWTDAQLLGVGGFNYAAATDYGSLNILGYSPDVTDMVFQLADNATANQDRFVFQMDEYTNNALQKYPLVMNGQYAAFDPRYSINVHSSQKSFASGTLQSATMYLDYNNRRVGIGTLTPSAPFHVSANAVSMRSIASTAGSSSYMEYNDSTGASRILFGVDGTGFANISPGAGLMATWTNHPLIFASNQAERLRITSAGNVGIGTSTPSSMLTVAGPMEFFSRGQGTDDSDPYRLEKIRTGANQNSLRLTMNDDGDEAFEIWGNSCASPGGCGGSGVALVHFRSNGNVGIGTTNPAAMLEVNGQVKINGGVPGAGKVLTSDANGLATWQTPSAGGVGNYRYVLTSAASRTSNLLGDLGLTSVSLPNGYYNFRSIIRFRTAATTTGIGLALASNGATITNYAGQLQAQTVSNAVQVYSNGTVGSTALVSTQVPLANTDYIATFDGVFQVTSPGSVKLQFRSEVNGSNVTIQPGSNFIIEPL